MKRFFYLMLLLPLFSEAQIIYPTGVVYDSTTFRFTNTDSLTHVMPSMSSALAHITIDTAGSALWQIGKTLKPVFSNTVTPAVGIMTDTLHPYPKSANSSFLLKMDRGLPNFIIDIWHRYETDSTHAGGIIEFSTDTGATWMNVANCGYINKVNFYSATDTLKTGEAAFMGTGSGQQLARLQVINCWGEKTTATTCMMFDNGGLQSFYLRFRFVSDTTVDSLSGWKIDSIKIENPGCIPGYVPMVNNEPKLTVFPNPVNDVLTIEFAETITSVQITDLLGRTKFNNNFHSAHVEVNIAKLPAGIYFVKVNERAVRKFVKE